MRGDSVQTPDFTPTMLRQSDMKLRRCQWKQLGCECQRRWRSNNHRKRKAQLARRKEKAVAQRQPLAEGLFYPQQTCFQVLLRLTPLGYRQTGLGRSTRQISHAASCIFSKASSEDVPVAELLQSGAEIELVCTTLKAQCCKIWQNLMLIRLHPLAFLGFFTLLQRVCSGFNKVALESRQENYFHSLL